MRKEEAQKQREQCSGWMSVLLCGLCEVTVNNNIFFVFSSLDDNQGGGDSHSISEAAHKLMSLTQNKHKPTLSSDKCSRQPTVIVRVQLARGMLGWEVRARQGCVDRVPHDLTGCVQDLGLFLSTVGAHRRVQVGMLSGQHCERAAA